MVELSENDKLIMSEMERLDKLKEDTRERLLKERAEKIASNPVNTIGPRVYKRVYKDDAIEKTTEKLEEDWEDDNDIFIPDESDWKKSGRNWRYTGKEPVVKIPHKIKGEELTSYESMFQVNKYVQTVISTNKNITNMKEMFRLSNTPSLSLRELETSGVKYMNEMFQDAKVLTIISLGFGEDSFKTPKLEYVSGMFQSVNARVIDSMEYLNVSEVKRFKDMFRGATINEVRGMEYFDTKSMTDMENMFADASIEKISFNTFNTHNRDLSGMFYSVRKMPNPLDLSGFSSVLSTHKILTLYRKTGISVVDPGAFDDLTVYVKDQAAMDRMGQYIKYNSTAKVKIGGRGYIPPIKKIEKQTQKKEEKVITHGTKRRKNRDMNSGEEKVVRKGKNGKQVITTTNILYVDGSVDQKVSKVTTVSSVDAIVEVGTLVSEERTKVDKTIEFETHYINDYEANKGERVYQEGQNGYVRYEVIKRIHDDDYEDEKKIGKEERKEPVIEVIAIGMIERSNQVTKDEILKFKTSSSKSYERKYKEDGEPHVVQAGKDGKVSRTYKVTTYTDDTPQKCDLISELTERTEPTKEILIYGLIESQSRVSKDEEIPFRTSSSYSYEYKHKERGEPHVIEKGKDGKISRSYQVTTYTDGTPQQWDLISEATKKTEPTKEVLIYGLIDTQKEEKEEKVIKFKVEKKYDKTLLEGEEEVVQEGIDGLDIRYYDVTNYIEHPLTGKTRTSFKEEIKGKREYTAATPYIIAIGSKDPIESIEEKVDETIIPFETRYIDTEELYVGQEEITKIGEDGKRVEKYQIITFVDESTKKHVISVNETAPVEQVVMRGIKDPLISEREEEEREEIPFEDAVIKTNDLPPGEKIVIKKGKNGVLITTYLIKEYGDRETEKEVTGKRIVNPQFQIVNLGVSRVITEQVKEYDTRETEYDTKREETDELYVGQSRVKIRGQNGKVQDIYVKTTFEDGGVERVLVGRKEIPTVDEVIIIGTKRRGADDSIKNIKPMNNKMTGDWLYLEDGDTTIRATVKTVIRPKWGYL